jgi:hypothetical protein
VFQHVASLETVTRSLIATVALMAIAMLLAGGFAVTGAAILTFSIWISILGLIVLGAFLIVRAHRACAGAGAVVAAVAVWMAYFWRSNPGPLLWPVVFLLAVALIVYGTRPDVSLPHAWLQLLPRFVVGWAFLDNAQTTTPGRSMEATSSRPQTRQFSEDRVGSWKRRIPPF